VTRPVKLHMSLEMMAGTSTDAARLINIFSGMLASPSSNGRHVLDHSARPSLTDPLMTFRLRDKCLLTDLQKTNAFARSITGPIMEGTGSSRNLRKALASI